MAFLILFLSLIGSAHASVEHGALKSLENCDKTKALIWAKLLDQKNTKQGLLYKLAWLQRSQIPSSETPLPEDGKAWEWKPDGELWKDEDPSANSRCVQRGKNALSMAALPQSVLDQLMKPALQLNFSQNPQARKTLLNYALFKYIRGERLDMPPSQAADCEWDALRLLHSEKFTAEDFKNLCTRCEIKAGLLGANFYLTAGDEELKLDHFDSANSYYQKAADMIPSGSGVTPRFWYRLAITSALGSAADDQVLRSLQKALESNDETEGDLIPPLNQSILNHVVCGRLESIQLQSLQKTLRSVFSEKNHFAQSAQLFQNCSAEYFTKVLKSMLFELKGEDKTRAQRWMGLRERRLQAQRKSAVGQVSENFAGLKTQEISAQSELSLPLGFALPAYRVKGEVQVDFLKLYRESL